MKRTESGKPYLSWCMMIRNDEATLEACLKSIRERTPQAEIVIVDNQSRDASPEIAQRYADVWVSYKGPRGDWDKDMPFTDDAAAARQLSFELASGTWRGWIDGDDRLPGPEETERLLRLNNQWCPTPSGAKVDGDTQTVRGLEDNLRWLEGAYPQADCVWAPYLYKRDENDQAHIWQSRERIIKWSDPPKWRWAEKAHEILVPIGGHIPMRVDFAHFLFVHERQFSPESYLYSLRRHYAVLLKQYEEEPHTNRRCLYLAAYAKDLDPKREWEFLEEAHRCSTISMDRYRALMGKAAYCVARGHYFDALEHYGAATMLRPEMPDAWYRGGESWFAIEDYGRAADWLEKAIACKPGHPDSYISPREHAVRIPTLAAEAYRKIARLLGGGEGAARALNLATAHSKAVVENEAVGADRQEAVVRLLRADNERQAEDQSQAIAGLAEYLLANDESQKALALLKSVPWNLQDHPRILALEKRLSPVQRHLQSEDAYSEFYSGSDPETGYMPSPEAWLDPDTCMSRTKWAAEWLNANAPNARVLDLGCFDGIMGIPLLRLCPGIKYTGVDMYPEAVNRFRERAIRYGVADRCEVRYERDGIRGLSFGEAGDIFDVILWCEVIEHVPDVEEELRELSLHLEHNGHILLTTPWGSFDAGHPPPTTGEGHERGHRGHVRAMTALDMVRALDDASLQAVELFKDPAPPTMAGDGMLVHATRLRRRDKERVSVSVPAALWDWNASTVMREGMGASEKSIVQITRALAADGRRAVDVFGPVPEEEVRGGVGYWPRSHLRHVQDGIVLVSRSPSHGLNVDEITGRKTRKMLWLQDAWYPDLNPETASIYERVICVSEWHKQLMHERHGVPLDQMVVLPNPIQPELFRVPGIERKRDHFVYCSSPDRGLIPLLRLWPRIRERLPNATLDIFYGWRGCAKLALGHDANWIARYTETRREYDRLKDQGGIRERGMVPPFVLALEMRRAGVWGYFTDFCETWGTVAVEARAAGCIPVATKVAALNESAACPQARMIEPGDEDGFVEACVAATEASDADREAMAVEAQEKFSVEAMLPRWEELLQ